MPTPPRSYGLDNVRSLMVLCILLLHAACAYSFIVPWWHALDSNHLFFDLLIICLDTFALPVLFFISGVFAAPSHDRHGPKQFLIRKLKRLGLPIVILGSVLIPAMVYMGYLDRADEPLSFFKYWLAWMQSLGDWSFRLFIDMEGSAPFQDQFRPHHLWFLSLLLLFFLGYALFRRIGVSFPSRRGFAHLLLVPFLAMVLSFAGVNMLIQDWGWFKFGPFILLQPTRIPIYLIAFIMGRGPQTK